MFDELSGQLTVRLPAPLAEALRRAARRQLSSTSVYIRQAIHARLKAEGALDDQEADGSTDERALHTSGGFNAPKNA